MKEMRSLVAALLFFAGVVAIGIIWDLWPTLLSESTAISSNTQ